MFINHFHSEIGTFSKLLFPKKDLKQLVKLQGIRNLKRFCSCSNIKQQFIHIYWTIKVWSGVLALQALEAVLVYFTGTQGRTSYDWNLQKQNNPKLDSGHARHILTRRLTRTIIQPDLQKYNNIINSIDMSDNYRIRTRKF